MVHATASVAHPAIVDPSAERSERLRALVQTRYEFVWRSLRRLGVPDSDVEDWTQEVFVTVSRRLDDIEAGKEKSYLYRIAVHHAAHAHRGRGRRREVPYPANLQFTAPQTPDRDLDEARTLRRCYEILDSMNFDLRTVFVLYELEQFSMAEIAESLQIPTGTVASRLRRARKVFLDQVHAPPNDEGPG